MNQVAAAAFTWYSALVRLVSRVSSDVLLKMGKLGELSLTNLTSVRFNSKMYPRMLG